VSTAQTEPAPYRAGGRHRRGRIWENSPLRLVPQVLVLTARILRRWSRDPATLVQSLVMPAGFLVALDIVFGDVIKQVTGHSGLYGQVPLVALVGGMTGAIIGSVNVMREREVGLLSCGCSCRRCSVWRCRRPC
jgi:ABC-2 type transport system permease protein